MTTTSSQPQCLHRLTLSAQPSCVAFSPSYTNLFVIGTYNLDDQSSTDAALNRGEDTQANPKSNTQSRSGTVQLFHLEDDGNINHLQTHNLSTSTSSEALGSKNPSGAVLDLKFCPVKDYQDLLAVSTSTGLILLLHLTITAPGVPPNGTPEAETRLDLLRHLQLFDAESLITSLSWCPDGNGHESCHDLAVTLSDGRVAIVQIPLPSAGSLHESDDREVHDNNRADDRIIWTRQIHQESAWVMQWLSPSTMQDSSSSNDTNSRTILTGGDDASIHRLTLPIIHDTTMNNTSLSITTDEEEENEEEEEALHAIDLSALSNPPQKQEHSYDYRTHSAGVTSILPLRFPHPVSHAEAEAEVDNAPAILTGSYDQHLRLLKPRLAARWVELVPGVDLEGGVWKLDLLSAEWEQSSEWYHWIVLASCMHAGVRVVRVSRYYGGRAERNEEWKIDVLARFEGHGSMCYGSAAAEVLSNSISEAKGTSRKRKWRVVSTSFYDRLVCVWDFEVD